MKNQAMVMTDVRKFELQDIPMPEVKPDEIGVKVRSISICGSDMGFFDGKAFSIFPDSLPFVLGHEVAGEVYEVGSNVTDFKVGDRVCLEPGVPDCTCEFCMTGRYNMCKNVKFLATPPYEGAMKRYISYPAFKAFKLADNMSFTAGALCEPLSVGLHAVRRGRVSVGKTVTILGGGAIGMCTLLAAKAYGASRIIVCDLFDSHLDKALELGATDVINSGNVDPIEKIKELTGGEGTDVVFETAGAPITASQTAYIVKTGGTIVMVGNILKEVPFSFRQLYRKEAEVRAVFRYTNTYPIAIQAISTGRIDVEKLVSSVFPFEKSEEAFIEAIDNKVNCVKAVITIDD